MGVISSWVVDPIVASLGNDSDVKETLGPLMVLRVLRLFRLARAVRLLVQFKTLWMLVRGLISSAGTIMYTFILLFLMLYIFACLSVELIFKSEQKKHHADFKQLVDEYWCDLPTSMLTFVQFVNLDSAAGIYAPMIKRDPILLI